MSPRVATKTRTKTRTKVIVGVVAASLAAAAGFGLFALRNRRSFSFSRAPSAPSFSVVKLSNTSLVDGENVLYRFKVSARSKTYLKKLSFVVKTNPDSLNLTQVQLRKADGGTSLGTEFSGLSTSGASCGAVLKKDERCIVIAMRSPYVLGSRKSQALELVAKVVGSDFGDSVTTQLAFDSSKTSGNLAGKGENLSIRKNVSALIWNNAGLKSRRWYNGGYVKNPPKAAMTLASTEPLRPERGETKVGVDVSCAPLSGSAVIAAAPVYSLASLPTTVMVSGNNTIARITLSAPASGDVEIHQLAISSVSDAIISTVDVREAGAGTNLVETTTAAPGFAANETFFWFNLDTPLVIAAGTSRTLDFRSVLSGVSPGKSISTRLLLDTEPVRACTIDDPLSDSRGHLNGSYADMIWSAVSVDGYYNGGYTTGPDTQTLISPAPIPPPPPPSTGDNPPMFSLSSLPTSTMTNGQNTVLRFSVIAPADEDATFKKFSFLLAPLSGDFSISSPSLKLVGEGSALPASSAILTGDPCPATVSADDRCATIVLDPPWSIAAGQVRIFDLSIVLSGVGSGDTLSTKLVFDEVKVTGALVGSGVDTSIFDTSIPAALIWLEEFSTTWLNGGYFTPLPAMTLLAP